MIRQDCGDLTKDGLCLFRRCLERRGRFDPLAGKIEILLTPSGIDRQLGCSNAVLGMAAVQLLECRQIFGVLLLIEVLQCRYHRRSFDLFFLIATRSQAKSFV